MDNYQFLRDYQDLQYEIMFDRLIDLGFCRIGYCHGENSSFWNQALTNKILSNEQVEVIESTLNKLKRDSTIYFENKKSLDGLTFLLKNKQYKFSFEDSWLFHSGENISQDRFKEVKKVTSTSELKVFIDTFDACYQKNDPQNAYGELGDYLKVAKTVWEKHNKTNRIEYFTCYEKNEPVAVSSLTNYGNIGYISNVGSLRKVRGRGFGKLATYYCVVESKKQGNKHHCLATEDNTFADDFYKRIGFRKKFCAVAYTKLLLDKKKLSL